jgi:hypothetical protein
MYSCDVGHVGQIESIRLLLGVVYFELVLLLLDNLGVCLVYDDFNTLLPVQVYLPVCTGRNTLHPSKIQFLSCAHSIFFYIIIIIVIIVVSVPHVPHLFQEAIQRITSTHPSVHQDTITNILRNTVSKSSGPDDLSKTTRR